MTAKYDKIGTSYDTTRHADPVLVDRLVSGLRVSADSRYLDLACGSGNYTSAMERLGGLWTGIDHSNVMLEKAAAKSADIGWVKAKVNQLPFAGRSFDGVTCTLAIHHFLSLEAAFLEVRRVMRDGRFVIFTSTTEQMKGYWLQEYFPVAMARSWEQMPDLKSIESALDKAGFSINKIEPYFVQDDLQDFFLYSGKHRPAMYINADVRRGISTFSSLADKEEIVEGCKRLRTDIESDKISEVIHKYENDLGDYSFVVSEKTT